MIYNGSDKHKIALFEGKQDKLTAGDNISLTPLSDGTVRIDAGGGSGTVTDVLVDEVSVVNEDGVAEITMPSDFVGATSQQAGTHGLVPASLIADKDKFLKGDGTWGEAGGGNVDDVQMNGVSIVDANKVASFNNYVELTRAEWEALPDSKYTDDILYCIKDGGSEKAEFFYPIIYSFVEREVGVWEDGRPLYQKSGYIPYSHFVTDGYQKRVDIASELSLSNIDIKNYDGYLSSPNFGKCTIGSMMYRGNQDLTHLESAFYYGLLVLRSYYNNSIVTNPDDVSSAGVAYYAPDLYVTIQYTKTTDNPGTGKWTTSGVPAHHYSTDEQVIGTWLDGSTLYEKTFALTIPNTSGDYLFPNTAIQNWNFTADIKWTINGRGPRTATPWVTQYTMYLDEFSANGLYFYFQSTANAGLSLHVTIQYTKSS